MSVPPRPAGLLIASSLVSLLVGWFATRGLHSAFVRPQTGSTERMAAPVPAESRPPARLAPPPGSATLSERLDRAGEALAKSGSSTERIVAVFALAETLRLDEFKTAIALSKAPNLSGIDQLLFGYWLECDLSSAIAWFETLDETQQSTYSDTLVQTWAAMDPRAALIWIEKLPPTTARSVVESSQYVLAQQAGPVEPDRVLALLTPIAGDSGMIGLVAGSPGDVKGGNLSGVGVFFDALAQKAPADAAARALRLPSGTHRTSATIAVAKVWARTDPQSAKAWAEKIDDAALAGQVIPACAIGLAEKDPQQAAEWLADLAGTLPNRDGMKEVLSVWGQKDVAGALSWLDNQPPDSGAEQFVESIFSKMATEDPVRMLDLIKNRLDQNKPFRNPPVSFGFNYVKAKGAKAALEFAATSLQHEKSPGSLQTYEALVNAAAQDNPVETTAWAAQQPGGTRRQSALEFSAPFLFQSDPEAGFRWVNGLPKDPDSDRARLLIADRLFQTKPERAAELFMGVTDREDAQNKLMWKAHDALLAKKDGVSNWLDKTPALTAEQKALVRRKVKENSK